MNEEVKKYIQDARKDGSRPEDIRKALVNSGWSGNVVDEILRDIQDAKAPTVVSPKGKLHPAGSKMTLTLGLIAIAVMVIGAGVFIILTKNQGSKIAPDLVSPPPKQSPVETAKPQPTPPAGQLVAVQERTANDDGIETDAAKPTPALPESGETVTSEGVTFAKLGTAYQSAENPFVVGGKIGYIAQRKDNNKEIIVYDGKEYGGQYDRISSPTDVNGKLAFVAAENLRFRQHYLYFDGHVTTLSKEYWGPIYLYSVGEKPAFAATLKDETTDAVVMDGKEIGRYRHVNPISAGTYSGITDINGKTAFVSQVKVGENQWKNAVYFDGKEIGRYDSVYFLTNVGGRLAYAVVDGEQNYSRYRIVINGQYLGNEYVDSWAGGEKLVVFNGKLAYIAPGGSVMVEGQPLATAVTRSPHHLFVYQNQLAFIEGKQADNSLIIGEKKIQHAGAEIRKAQTVNGRLFYQTVQSSSGTGGPKVVYVFDGQQYVPPFGGVLYNANIGAGEFLDGTKPVYVIWQDPNEQTIFGKRGVFIHGDKTPRCGWHDEILDIASGRDGTVYLLARDGETAKVWDESCQVVFDGPKPWPRRNRPSSLSIINGKIIVRASDRAIYIDGKEGVKTRGDFYGDIEDPVEIGGKIGFIFNDSEDGYDKQFIVYDGKEYGRGYARAYQPFEFQGQLGYLADDKMEPNRLSSWNNFIVAGGREIGREYVAVVEPTVINGQLMYLATEKIDPAAEVTDKNLKFSIVQGGRKIYQNDKYLNIGYLKEIDGKLTFMAQVAERKFTHEGEPEQDEKFIVVYDGTEYGREYETVTGFSELDGKLVFSARDQRQTGLGLYPRYFFVLDGKEYGPKTEGLGYEISKDSPVSINGKLVYRIRFGNPYADTNEEFIMYGGKKIYSSTFIEDLINVNGKLAFETKEKFREIILLER